MMKQLISQLNVENAWDLLQRNILDPEKSQVILDFICIQASELSQPSNLHSFLNIEEETLILFLKSEGFSVTEDELLELVIGWLRFHKRSVTGSSHILNYLKPPYLTEESLEKHKNFLYDTGDQWKNMVYSPSNNYLAYRASKNHPLRENPAYIPREFDVVCKRWNRAVLSCGFYSSTNILGKQYAGIWQSGSHKQKIFTYSLIFKFEEVKDIENGLQSIKGRILWRLEHFHHRNHDQIEFESPFYEELSERFGHRAIEIFTGTFNPEHGVICFTGNEIQRYPYDKQYSMEVIALDSYRLRLLAGNHLISGVAKGHQNSYDNPIDAVRIK